MADDDTSLLQKAVEGDVAALRALLERFGGEVRQRISGRIDKRWQALLDEDDVMQVAYLEAFLHIDQLTARDTTSFLAWLTRIAENAIRDAIRGLSRQKRPDPARRVVSSPATDSYVGLLECLGVTTTTPSREAVSKMRPRSSRPPSRAPAGLSDGSAPLRSGRAIGIRRGRGDEPLGRGRPHAPGPRPRPTPARLGKQFAIFHRNGVKITLGMSSKGGS
jgi:DNA-directed RNA polymerase specialized sigma24 family protein